MKKKMLRRRLIRSNSQYLKKTLQKRKISIDNSF